MSTSPILSCIGAGRLGSTLCKLLAQHLSIGQVLNRSQASSDQAAEFIGAGTAINNSDQLQTADIWLLATPDDAIESNFKILQARSMLRSGDIVFHCSGALTAAILRQPSVLSASIHPMHSFADPQRSAKNFAGTPCAIEGHPSAVAKLVKLFNAIGARPFEISSTQKVLYHAAAVMSCNYLVTLLDTGENILRAAGIDSGGPADSPLRPLIEQTIQNYYSTSAKRALTGPIARGDHGTVVAHLSALEKSSTANPMWPDLYRSLGLASVLLARQLNPTGSAELDRIEKLLRADKDAQINP